MWIVNVAEMLGIMPSPEKLVRRPAAKRAGPALPKWLTGAMPADVALEKSSFDGPGGPVKVHIYGPAGSDRVLPGLVYIHGGGWVGGAVHTTDVICGMLSSKADLRVVSIDYRLAPDAPFPGPLDDCAAGLQWVFDHAAELYIDPDRLGVAGDSAGGNLSAALAIKARDEGLPQLRFQGLIYPVVDAAMSTPSMAYSGPALKQAAMSVFYDAYAGSHDRTLPLISPLQVPSAAGLPTAAVITSGHDCLADEGELYADKLRAAGVQVEYVHYKDAPHGFFSLAGLCSQSGPAIDFLAAALKKALH